MGIVNIIQNIKKIHQEYVILIKIGTFYQVYGKDAYIISYLLGYKIKKVENTIMCGFPNSSICRVIATLENHKINYLILDRRNNYDVDEKMNYKNLNRYTKELEKASEYVKIRKRIENIYEYLLENVKKDSLKKILIQMEDMITNERRKI